MTNQSSPVWVIVGHFNNDKIFDIPVANSVGDNNSVLLGQANGTFEDAPMLWTGSNSGPVSLATGDFNNDSLVDLAISNSNTHTITIMLRYKSEPFGAQTTFSTGINSRPSSVAVGYFNKDDKLAIAVANSGTDNIGIFLGYRNGSFASQRIYPLDENSGPVSIVIVDFDNDGKRDIAVANSKSNNISIYFGYENGNFTTLTTYFTGLASIPSAIVAADDLDKNNYLDIIVSLSGSHNVLVFFGISNGSFSKSQ